MKKVSQFHGSFRAVVGIAGLTTRELVRSGAAPFSFLFFVGFLAFFGSDSDLEEHAAQARFIDHALGGIGVVTMFLAVFFGMQLAARGESKKPSCYLLRRIVGPASFFWGRLLGLASVLVLFGLLCGAVVLVHHRVRFGDLDVGGLEVREESHDFDSRRQVKFMRKRGDQVQLSFAVDTNDIMAENEPGMIAGRFSPRLVLMAGDGSARADCLVKLTISDPDSQWKTKKSLHIHEGRALRFFVKLPSKRRPHRLLLTLENRSRSYLVKLRQGDLQLVSKTRSFAGGVMRAALGLSLLASVLSSFALFFREHMAFGPSLLAAFGFVVLTVSVELLEYGVLADASEGMRQAIVATVTTILPDANEFDVIQRIARGRDIGWDVVTELVLRFSLGALLMGLISGWVNRQGADA